MTDYKTIKDYVDIICPIHGKFRQLASSHIRGNGCKSCKESKGELKISKILNENNIKYIKEIERFGGKVKLDYYTKNDNIKNSFCNTNSIKLFRIKYDQDIDLEMTKIIDYLWQK